MRHVPDSREVVMIRPCCYDPTTGWLPCPCGWRQQACSGHWGTSTCPATWKSPRWGFSAIPSLVRRSTWPCRWQKTPRMCKRRCRSFANLKANDGFKFVLFSSLTRPVYIIYQYYINDVILYKQRVSPRLFSSSPTRLWIYSILAILTITASNFESLYS